MRYKKLDSGFIGGFEMAKKNKANKESNKIAVWIPNEYVHEMDRVFSVFERSLRT